VTVIDNRRKPLMCDGVATLELKSRLASMLRMSELGIPLSADVVKAAMQSAEAAEARLKSLTKRVSDLRAKACTDELTGVLNRRGFLDQLTLTLASASRYGESGILIYMDLDGFKPINDTFGHAAGDAVLKRVATLLSKNTRSSDVVGRIGGDEFTVLMPRTDPDAGRTRALALEHRLNAETAAWQGDLFPINVSVGFHVFSSGVTPEQLLQAADNDMYAVKQERNRAA